MVPPSFIHFILWCPENRKIQWIKVGIIRGCRTCIAHTLVQCLRIEKPYSVGLKKGKIADLVKPSTEIRGQRRGGTIPRAFFYVNRILKGVYLVLSTGNHWVIHWEMLVQPEEEYPDGHCSWRDIFFLNVFFSFTICSCPRENFIWRIRRPFGNALELKNRPQIYSALSTSTSSNSRCLFQGQISVS